MKLFNLFVIVLTLTISSAFTRLIKREGSDCELEIMKSEYGTCYDGSSGGEGQKESCKILTSEKCIKFYSDVASVVPKCGEVDLKFIQPYLTIKKDIYQAACTTDGEGNFCSFSALEFADATDYTDSAIISGTCQSKKCTNAYTQFLESNIKLNEFLRSQSNGDDWNQSNTDKLTEAKNQLTATECVSQNKNDLSSGTATRFTTKILSSILVTVAFTGIFYL
ncbi:hypothetical protein PIROE2DRAFT_13960 [Piromyces sp. E2]|nr:hypothetical protein PIROE2DRAFT_13960 [Piromyces sp. E2]|eukprot:OUM60303.1 hypothetical protein PIROE2DRAFT_13960 [Piromyces sp. E2]